MRESNFAFPAQNKACVCITSQLYDRRALDTSSALPLFNSLQHLTYLTSTSPRIREIMTMDGGLERLVRILHDFCLAPPPPASPAAFYGLLPPSHHPPRPPPQLNPPAGQFDKYAASRFSLAFKCVVNIGVRGSEPIRSRVVQAGTLDVVGCILEAWLAGRGFAVGPSTSATGLPRETREARAARRAAAAAGRGRAEQDLTPAVPPHRLLAINTADAVPVPGTYVSADGRFTYVPRSNAGAVAATSSTASASSRDPASRSRETGSGGLRPADDEDPEATTPIVRDRSATVVVRRRADGGHHARENTNAYASSSASTSNTHTTSSNPAMPPNTHPSLHALYALHAAQHPHATAPPASPSASSTTSATSITSARGSPSSHSGASTGARTSPVSSRASPVSAMSSRPSSRASPSPSPSETDGDVDSYAEGDREDGEGDVEMVAAGVAGLGVGALGAADGPHAHAHPLPHALHHGHGHRDRGRVGDSSASASPSPPPLNMGLNITQEEGMGANMANMNMAGMMNANMMGMNANMMGMGMGGMMGMGMEGMGLMGLNRDPRIAGEEGGVGMGMGLGINGGIGGDETMGMEGDAAGMMLNMGMMNGELDGMGMLGGGMMGGGMGMMNPNMMGMGMGMNGAMAMNMGGLGMMGGMPLPRMGDVSGSAGGDSEARADTDADAEESDAGVGTSTLTTGTRRRGEDDTQTQTPRAGVVRLPSPAPTSPGAGSSSASSSSAVYDEDEADLDEEEGEVVVAVRGGGSGSGTMRRAGTVRGPTRPPLPEASTSASAVETRTASTTTVGRVHSLSYRERADTARQPAASSSSVSTPPPAATPSTQHPTPGAPRVPPPLTPAVRARRATAAEVPEPPIAAAPAPPRTRDRDDREERHHHHAHTHAHQTGPYRDDDVLLSLQLLAYLSKYPHVRQAFYKRRNGFHPASALALAAAKTADAPEPLPKAPEIVREKGRQPTSGQHPFFRAFGAGKEKEKGKAPAPRASTAVPPTPPATSSTSSTRALETNVFSLVERFTFRPSSSETDLPNPPPRLPQEIQYWAGVIMRNACRKDDSRGGIRQCANMLCGRWEEYPREFAKCRRCRKAKYCGKECQSTAWSEGHRFWCSAKEGDDAPDATGGAAASTMATSASNATIMPDAPDPNAVVPVGAERRERRERYAARERDRLAVAAATANAVLGGNAGGGTTAADAATVRGFRSAGIFGAHPNTVSAVFGGTPSPAAATPANAPAGPSQERPAAPAESTRTPAMALLRRTANPLGAVGSPVPAPQRRERERETNSSYATFDTYMAERRRAETTAAAASTAASPVATPALPNYLHHPQPQNPADIDRYLASFASPPRRRVSRTSRDGDASSTRSGGAIWEPPASGSAGTSGDADDMVLE